MGNIKSQELTPQIQLLMWRRGRLMDSNSTLAPNYPGSDRCIAYPSFPRPRLRNYLCIAGFPRPEKDQPPLSSSLQEGDLFYESLFVSGVKSRPRNLWATVG